MAPLLHHKGQAKSGRRKAADKRYKQARTEQRRNERKAPGLKPRREAESSAQISSKDFVERHILSNNKSILHIICKKVNVSFAAAKNILPPAIFNPTHCDATLVSAILASLEAEYPTGVARLRREMGLVWDQGGCMGPDTSFTFESMCLWILDNEHTSPVGPFKLDLNDIDLAAPFKALVQRLRADLANSV